VAYATPADLLLRKSEQTIGQLVSEDGTAVSSGALATDDKVLAALESASGAIDAALLQAGRYEPSDLAALTDNSLAHLKHITCEIAMAYLFAIKPTYATDDYKAQMDLHDLYLERLRKGENVFNISKVIEAGTPKLSRPSVAAVTQLNLLRDRTLHYYPYRVQ
jgi:phage gp36-like protein